MSPRIRGHRPDKTHDEVVKALRAVGASVVPLVSTGGGGWERTGLPDLLVGFRGETWLFEVKGADGKLRGTQVEWARKWTGCQPLVVRSASEALSALGIVAERIERHDGAIDETRPGTKPGRARSLAFMKASLAAARERDEGHHGGEDGEGGHDEDHEERDPA